VIRSMWSIDGSPFIISVLVAGIGLPGKRCLLKFRMSCQWSLSVRVYDLFAGIFLSNRFHSKIGICEKIVSWLN
jgi:hypothetical protein